MTTIHIWGHDYEVAAKGSEQELRAKLIEGCDNVKGNTPAERMARRRAIIKANQLRLNASHAV